jgi:hypothetical protein
LQSEPACRTICVTIEDLDLSVAKYTKLRTRGSSGRLTSILVVLRFEEEVRVGILELIW